MIQTFFQTLPGAPLLCRTKIPIGRKDNIHTTSGKKLLCIVIDFGMFEGKYSTVKHIKQKKRSKALFANFM